MSQIARLAFGTEQALGMALLGLVYVRVGLPLMNRVGEGPFTAPVDLMRTIVPVVIGGYFLILALFVIAGPVQRERTAQREVRRR